MKAAIQITAVVECNSLGDPDDFAIGDAVIDAIEDQESLDFLELTGTVEPVT